MIEPSATRETARLGMPEALRRDVRLLGELLGQIVAESGGAELLQAVERLRRAVIAPRDDAEPERRCELLVASWSLQRAEDVARAFTCYFHLVNLAEEQHRQRVLRERERGGAPLSESLAATVAALRDGPSAERLRAQLARLRLHPVLTAHPTEARRRAVVNALRRIGRQLTRLADPQCSDPERADARRRLLEEIDVLWRTAQIRTVHPDPLDEVRATLAVFDEALFESVPGIYRLLDTSLSPEDAGRRPPMAPSFIRFGSWAGGDRDGNPLVTAAATAAAMAIHVGQGLRALEAATASVARALTAERSMAPADPALTGRLQRARDSDPQGFALIARSSPDEPHRQFLLHVAGRLHATREEAARGYRGPEEFLDDLRVTQVSLAAGGAERLAYGELQHLVWHAETFGFALAELEIRQHSRAHERALTEIRSVGSGETLSAATQEVLDTLRVVASLQQKYGRSACHRYVVSFTRSAADVAAVYELAEYAGGQAPPLLDVVPLFESGDDLRRAAAVLDGVIELSAVRRRLADNGRRLEVMLGYSDSAKEMGPVAATFALYDAQTELVAWAARHGIGLTIFHGRGGALGRGGGPANRAVLAQAPGSMAGGFKVTEQGEVVFARYGNPAIARRHLEQVASAVLIASTPAVEERVTRTATRFRALAERISEAARVSYRALVEVPGFAEWFARVSPLEELDRLRLGSRPARRSSGGSLEELRAIPWVFAWSQVRLNLPGWYGLGSGLQAARPAELREAYAEWPLFASLLDNAEMSLAKTDRRIAARYLELGARPDLTARILAEYDRSMEHLLAVTGHDRLLADRPVLSWAVALRNPYVDALSHIQLRALGALRAGAAGSERERLERLLLLTVNGVAAGLQNTG